MLAWFFSRVKPTCEGLSPYKCAPRAYERNKSKPGPLTRETNQSQGPHFHAQLLPWLISWAPNDPAAAQPDPYLYPSCCLYNKGRRQAEERVVRGEKKDGVRGGEKKKTGAYAAGCCSCIHARNHASLLCKTRRSRRSASAGGRPGSFVASRHWRISNTRRLDVLRR
jgi:hypothetical protein